MNENERVTGELKIFKKIIQTNDAIFLNNHGYSQIKKHTNKDKGDSSCDSLYIFLTKKIELEVYSRKVPIPSEDENQPVHFTHTSCGMSHVIYKTGKIPSSYNSLTISVHMSPLQPTLDGILAPSLDESISYAFY
jgi:hypothetical protein